jgi:hypothetical protein
MKNGNGKKPEKKRVPLSPKGGALLIPGNPGNSGGKPGRSGRPTNHFKAELEAIRNDEIPQRIREIITTGKPKSAEWRWAVDRVLEYTTSKAPQKQEIGGSDLPIRFKLDLMAASMARLHE